MGVRTVVAAAALAAGALGCSAGDVNGSGDLPPDVQDPEGVETPAGAIGFYRNVESRILPKELEAFLTYTGVLTDELVALPAPIGFVGNYTLLDSRHDLSSADRTYDGLHRMRAQAAQARSFLATYAPDSSAALQGHMYAVEAFAEILLADAYCSGIPLSQVDFEGDYTLAAGSTTEEVYEHAVALLDSALAVSADSARTGHFAAVAKGRALLALGRYADAAAAVAAVPDDYLYQGVFAVEQDRLLRQFAANYRSGYATPNVADREGVNGLDYRSSGDPRTASDTLGSSTYGNLNFPRKYPTDGPVTLTIADGVEARLIEAEAALQAGDAGTWLGKLNALRATIALPDTTDPGDPAARTDLMFRERAFWLFLTGHRQGDMRRLVREYGRSPDTVYPVGVYQGGPGSYGREVVVPVPDEEQEYNPKYTGCFNRNA